MKLLDFIKALLPTFGRDRILEDIRITRGELTALLPAYEQSADFFRTWKFKSQPVVKLNSLIKNVGGRKLDNPVTYISANLPKILLNLKVAEDLVVANLNAQIGGASLTFKQMTVLQYVDAMFLVSKYARKYLNYLYVHESAEFKDYSLSPSDSIPPIEEKWINDKAVDFVNALLAVTHEPKEVAEKIEEIPDVVATQSNVQNLKTTLGEDKIDPLKMGFIATKANPIYFVRMIVAEWQVNRYKLMKDELTVLHLRKLNLEKLKAGRSDAKLERELAVVESRIQEVSYKLDEMEKE